MKFPKQFMNYSELAKIGFPESTLQRVRNEPGQDICFKANPKQRNAKVVYDTSKLNQFLIAEIEQDQALRGII